MQVKWDQEVGRPRRAMEAAAAKLKTDLQSNSKVKAVDTYILKLPRNDSHQFHEIGGEVRAGRKSCFRLSL